MLFGLAVVIGLLVGALFLLKRLSNPAGSLQGAMRTRGAIAVGPRERVVLLEIGGKVLVLGVAPGQVTSLLTLEASELPAATPVATALDTGGRDFQSWLRQMMEKRNK
ncbi:MAG: flagellar biosynthetic protein FliO [Zoogloea sp.]|nr:flagellar biosynthetic protein FliO [Zoogloea sp.]